MISPELERRTITEADIDSEDFEVGAFVGVMSIEDFGSNVVYGARGAYHITEDFFVEEYQLYKINGGRLLEDP